MDTCYSCQAIYSCSVDASITTDQTEAHRSLSKQREIEHGIQGLQSFSSWGSQFIETYVISMIEGLGLMYQGAQEEQQ